jgi:TolB protein
MRSIVPVDHLQVICNGQVVHDLKLSGHREAAAIEETVSVSESGWCLLRAWSEKPEHPILDLYPYATTSPVYIQVSGSNPRPHEDAAYFIAWIDRLIEAATRNKDWNIGEEKSSVLAQLRSARQFYARLQN